MNNNTGFTNTKRDDYQSVTGWGIDADPKNDPTYPIKKRNNAEHLGYSWQRPPQQPIRPGILKSIERPNITAVYGATVPPRGLSGAIRRFAFKDSESSYLHWLPLLIADRVNVVEGVFQDLAKGKIPNIPAERGIKAEWKHNKKAVVTKFAVGAAIVGSIVAMCVMQRKRRCVK